MLSWLNIFLAGIVLLFAAWARYCYFDNMSKRYLFALLSALIPNVLSLPAVAKGPVDDHMLIVTLPDIQHLPASTIICGLFDHAAGFPLSASQAVATVKATLTSNQAQCIFKNLKPNYYAVAVLHDENGNGKLDTDMLGDPNEGWATSNNITHDLRAPDFEESKFAIDQPIQNIFLEMHY